MNFSHEKQSTLLIMFLPFKGEQKKLFKNIAFALKTVGYEVVHINPKIYHLHFKTVNFKDLISLAFGMTYQFHSPSLKKYSMDNFISIFLIFPKLKDFTILSLLNHEKLRGIVLLNPKFKKFSLNTLKCLDPSFKDKLYFIFSKKSFFRFNNKHARVFLKNQSDLSLRNVQLLKTKNHFLGMETILLSKILDIIQVHA
ncbi:MAG: hypothetical protein ACTSYC_04350 [Promethearchaeota archaeon]